MDFNVILELTAGRATKYLKASPLPPAPLAVAGFMVAGLVAWQCCDRLAGLLDFAVQLLSVGVFAGSLVSGCGGLAIF